MLHKICWSAKGLGAPHTMGFVDETCQRLMRRVVLLVADMPIQMLQSLKILLARHSSARMLCCKLRSMAIEELLQARHLAFKSRYRLKQ